MFVQDLADVICCNRPVPDIVRVNDHDWAFFAYSKATGIGDEDFAPDFPVLDLFKQLHHHVNTLLGVTKSFLLAVGP